MNRKEVPSHEHADQSDLHRGVHPLHRRHQDAGVCRYGKAGEPVFRDWDVDGGRGHASIQRVILGTGDCGDSCRSGDRSGSCQPGADDGHARVGRAFQRVRRDCQLAGRGSGICQGAEWWHGCLSRCLGSPERSGGPRMVRACGHRSRHPHRRRHFHREFDRVWQAVRKARRQAQDVPRTTFRESWLGWHRGWGGSADGR